MLYGFSSYKTGKWDSGLMQIVELNTGETAVIKHIAGEPRLRRRLAALGIRDGKTIRKIANISFNGPVVVEVDRAKVAIGRKIASKIFVEGLE